MPGTIAFTVPETVRTAFVVATDRRPRGPAVLTALGPPFAAAAAARIGTPALRIDDLAAAASPFDLAPVTARPAARHVCVTADLPARDRPFGARVARAVARAVAETTAGTAVDPDTGEVVAALPEDPDFALADDWLGVRLPPYRDVGRCAADEDAPDGCACVELTTRGLRRLGLPELRIGGVSCRNDVAALNLLRLAAQRLLPRAARPGVHRIPAEPELTGEDLAAYRGGGAPAWPGGPVRVRWEPIGPRLLGLGPPDGRPGSLNAWLYDEVPPQLHGPDPDDAAPF
ncbi:hypothetical protein [Actinomadura atramentaria]|uniref:hypothetical protein n=1 Tax=Actinomadura atramentaria TaxID=1990 RepID=UPI00035D292A|nr:hypothetical protein [Actinomadura atramentaria]